MFDMARHIRVKALLETVEALEDELSFNELEMVRHLKEKYVEPGHNDSDDVVALEVIVRNVAIRKGFDMDVKKDPGRVIPVESRRSDKV
jgi:hypothetical protein